MKNSLQYLDSLYESLEKATTVSLQGKKIKHDALQAPRTFNSFNKVLFESISDASGDDGLNAWANELVADTGEEAKILVNFNSVMESLSTEGEALQSALHNSAYDDLEYLTNLDATGLTKAISAGALSDYGWVPEFKELNSLFTNVGLRESVKSNEGLMYSPFSVLSEHNGSVVMRIKGKNYGMARDNRLYEVEAGADLGTANPVNNAIESIPYNDTDDRWELHSPVGMISISPYEKCVRLNGDAKSCEQLKESLSDAVTGDAIKFSTQDIGDLDNVILIAENLDDIAILDNVKIFENEVTHDSMVVVYPLGNPGTEISVIQNGKVEFADNIEEIVGYAADTYNVPLQKLQESFSSQIKARKLYESVLKEEAEGDAEFKTELEASLAEIDTELAMVDAGSDSAEELEAARAVIIAELEVLSV